MQDSGNFFDFWCKSPIQSVKTHHIEAFVGDVDNEAFDKFFRRDGFGDKLVIVMAIVVEGDIFAVIAVDSGLCDDGTTEVTTDIFYEVADFAL